MSTSCTYPALKARFIALDSDPQVIAQSIDGWMAWPVVKRRVWNAIRRQRYGSAGRLDMRVVRALPRLVSGICELTRHVMWPARRTIAAMYSPRMASCADGTIVHPHLDALVRSEHSVLHCTFGWGGYQEVKDLGAVREHGVAVVVAVVARIVARSSSIRLVAEQLAQPISRMFPDANDATLRWTIADQLARFRIRRWLYRVILIRNRVRAVVVTDAGGKTGEIAAARSLGLPVVEVQHGMFSHDEPDYAWRAAHRHASTAMALPDAIIVFGPLWKTELMRNGYWSDSQIVLANNPVLSSYLHRVTVRQRDPEVPLVVLFATQWYVRHEAIAFFERVLDLQRARGSRTFQLRIKLHPAEHSAPDEYAALANKYPGDCVLAPSSTEAFSEILHADLVIGFTSMMLLEAIGLGVPAVSIGVGEGKEGFCTAFGVDALRDLLPEVEAPAQFIAHMDAMSDPGAWRAARDAAATAAAAIYTLDGPSVEQAFTDVTNIRP